MLSLRAFKSGLWPQRCLYSFNTISSITKASEKIFSTPGAASFLAAAASPSSIPKLNGLPEVIVTGRANVGKSTLLNAVLGRSNLVHTSKKAGRTKALNFFNVGQPPGNLVLVDSPGYGLRGREEWGELFDYYIEHRERLRRIYILISANHGVTKFDIAMLEHLGDRLRIRPRPDVTVQAVFTKLDRIPENNAASQISAAQAELAKLVPSCLPPILTAVTKAHMIGIEYLRQSIAQACS